MASHHSHPSHPHYPHRPVVGPPVGHASAPPPPPPRIAELLDCAKQEYDNLQTEAQHLKNSNQEFESHGLIFTYLSHPTLLIIYF